MSSSERFGMGGATSGRIGCLTVGIVGTFTVLMLLVLLLIPALYRYVQQLGARHAQRKGIDAALPALELKPLTKGAQPVSLGELRGKIVLINFWATWCPPCRAELPEIARLYHDLATEPDFRLLAVSCGTGGPEDVKLLGDETQAFLAKQGLDLPAYADPDWVTRKAFDQVAGLQGYPTTFLVDRQGVIRGIWVGYSPGLVIAVKQHVAGLLASKPESPASAKAGAPGPAPSPTKP